MICASAAVKVVLIAARRLGAARQTASQIFEAVPATAEDEVNCIAEVQWALVEGFLLAEDALGTAQDHFRLLGDVLAM